MFRILQILSLFFLFITAFSGAQTKKTYKKHQVKKIVPRFNPKDYEKINDSLPALLLQRKNGKLGFVNQKGKIMIPFQYDFGNFFWEDCNLLNSPNPKLRKFGTSEYASVTLGHKDYRIDKTGKRVYTFKKEDLGACNPVLRQPRYFAYSYRGFWGVVNNKNFSTPEDYKSFTIYPQYQYLYVLESSDVNNPMIIASVNNKFGVIDIHNNLIIPFMYQDIKRNFSWKIGHMFEVSQDGVNYYFVDKDNKTY